MSYRLSREINTDYEYGSIRASLWVLLWFTAIVAFVLRRDSVSIVYDLGMVLFGFTAIVGLLSEARINLIHRFVDDCKYFYLNGRNVFTIFDEDLFRKLSFYVGHGLCYEVSALNMVILKKNRTARLVIVQAHRRHSNDVHWHSWVEFKKYGVWWVIDPTWDRKFINLRRAHNYHIPAEYRRIMPWDEFWSFQLSHDLWEMLQNRNTSYLFDELSHFRQISLKEPLRLHIDSLGHDVSIIHDGFALVSSEDIFDLITDES